MPFFDFKCSFCNEVFEELCSADTAMTSESNEKINCPKCNCSNVTRLFTGSFGVSFSNPEGTSKMDSFSWRAGHNMENAKECRRQAERTSHMGSKPYGE